MTAVELPKPARPPGPSLRLSLVLIIAGIALAIPTFIAGVVPIVRAATGPQRFDAPETVRVHLGKGDYMIYEYAGHNSIGNAFSHRNNVSISPGDVTVTSSDGTSIEVRERGDLDETLNVGGDRYDGAVRFTTPASGEYLVKVASTVPVAVLVARPFSEALRSVLGWFALAGLGGVAVVIGIILLIVGSVRRSRAKSVFAYAGATAPGWHPDPGGSGRWRYWDGGRWTEHVQ